MINIFKKIILLILNKYFYIYNRLLLSIRNTKYTSFPKIKGKIFLRGTGLIKFGNSISINSGTLANPIGGDTRMTIYIGPKGIIDIGNNTGISNSTIICYDNVKIGNNVKIGGSVKLYDTDFHSLDWKKRQNKKTDFPLSKPILIGDNSFIGAHSIILKGVSIGERSIIGAGSVVTKSIPSDEIWGGNPAKFIKKINA